MTREEREAYGQGGRAAQQNKYAEANPYKSANGGPRLSGRRTAWFNGYYSERIRRKFARTFKQYGISW